MDSRYQPIYKQAVDLQYKFHDYLGGVDHPETHALRNEIHQLIQDVSMKKDPRTLADRTRIIQQQLRQIQDQHPHEVSMDHTEHLRHEYKVMGEGLKRWDDYQG